MANLVASAFQFPPAQEDVAVSVSVSCDGESETCFRRFGNKRFRSVLSPAGAGRVYERFGPLTVLVSLTGDECVMGMDVTRAWFLSVPLPQWLRPRSVVRESVADGRFQFFV